MKGTMAPNYACMHTCLRLGSWLAPRVVGQLLPGALARKPVQDLLEPPDGLAPRVVGNVGGNVEGELQGRLYPLLGEARAPQGLLQGPQPDDEVLLRGQPTSCALGRDAGSCKAALCLDEAQDVVHQLLGQPLLGVDGLCGAAQDSPVGLETALLAQGILADLLGVFLDEKLQLRLLQLALEFLGRQVLRGALGGRRGAAAVRCSRPWGGIARWRGTRVVGRCWGIIAWSFSGVGSRLGGDRRGCKAARRVGGGLLGLLLAGHGEGSEAAMFWERSGASCTVAGPQMACLLGCFHQLGVCCFRCFHCPNHGTSGPRAAHNFLRLSARSQASKPGSGTRRLPFQVPNPTKATPRPTRGAAAIPTVPMTLCWDSVVGELEPLAWALSHHKVGASSGLLGQSSPGHLET